MISGQRMAIKFLCIVLVCLFVSGNAEVRCIQSEREALLSFKSGLIDDYGFLSLWQSTECCKWYIWCWVQQHHWPCHHPPLNTTNYVGVLQGEVGSSLLELHHLNYLDLSSNDFGSNPIPEFIGFMKQLQHLFLMGSNFFGIVPPHLGNLTNLRTLGLSHNSLRVKNLDWLTSLSMLSILDLSQINLT